MEGGQEYKENGVVIPSPSIQNLNQGFSENIILVDPDSTFEEKSTQRSFLRKIYALLMLQMFVTLCVMIWCAYDESVMEFFKAHSWMTWVFLLAMVIIVGAVYGLNEEIRTMPYSILAYLWFTAALSGLMGQVASFNTISELMISFAASTLIFLAVVIFACQSKFHFTFINGSLLAAFVILIVFMPIGFCLSVDPLHMFSCALATFLFSMFVVDNTRRMMKNQTLVMTPEEPAYATVVLYLELCTFIRYVRRCRCFCDER